MCGLVSILVCLWQTQENGPGFQSFWSLELWIKDWGPAFSSFWVWLKVPSWTFLLWGEVERKGGKPSAFILHRLFAQHRTGSFPSVIPLRGCVPVGARLDLTFRGKVSSVWSKSREQTANVFTQCLEQVGGLSANLSQLPLPVGMAERREAGRGQAEPLRVSDWRSHLPSSPWWRKRLLLQEE